MKIFKILFLFLLISNFSRAQVEISSYDNLNRISQKSYGNGSFINYQYDAVGNRTSQVIQAIPLTPILSVTPANLIISSSDSLMNIQVQNIGIGNMNWTAISNNLPWLSISGNISGTNNGSITVNSLANFGTQRTGTITITAAGAVNSPITITITQSTHNFTNHVWHISQAGSDISGTGRIDAPYKTIQHGIDVSASGDTVLIHNGTFMENINMNGKNLLTSSYFLYTNDTNDINNTIINGNQQDAVVKFVSNENQTSVLNGLCLINGHSIDGGGIHISGSNPKISNVRISGCTADYGAGINLYMGNPLLINMKISNCTADYGGGISGYMSDPSLLNVKISNCMAINSGGAISLNQSSPAISFCNFQNNDAQYGGALSLFNNSNSLIINSVFSFNHASVSGGAISIYQNCTPKIINCLIVNNYADSVGGVNSYLASPSFVNTAIINNKDLHGLGVYINECPGNALFINTLVWGNSIIIDTAYYSVSYCDIQGGYPGNTNIDQYPLFSDTTNADYRLLSLSPCNNNGSPDTLNLNLPTSDLAGKARISGSRIDIGPYENQCPQSLNNLQVSAGNDTTIIQGTSIQLAGLASGGNPPIKYFWQPASFLSNPLIANPICSSTSNNKYYLIVSDNDLCSARDSIQIWVNIPQIGNISGHVTYDNSIQSPLFNVAVKLFLGQALINTVHTDATGHFSFSQLTAGNYILNAAYTSPVGGINTADALLVLQHFVGMNIISGLRFIAADINGTQSLNSIDALTIARRFVGLISTFPLGDWLFEKDTITLLSQQSVTKDIKAICYGDVNGSYVPAAKLAPDVLLEKNGIIQMNSNEEVEIPVSVTNSMEIGAVSLVLHIPSECLKITNLRATKAGELVYNCIGNELRLSWYSLQPMNLTEGEPLFWIDGKLLTQADFSCDDWAIGAESQLADGNALTIHNASLNIPKFVLSGDDFYLSQNVPNPCTNNSAISYYMPESGKVTLRIYDAIGKEIKVLVNETQSAGVHTAKVYSANLPAGIYSYKIEITGQTRSFTKTRQMVVGK